MRQNPITDIYFSTCDSSFMSPGALFDFENTHFQKNKLKKKLKWQTKYFIVTNFISKTRF